MKRMTHRQILAQLAYFDSAAWMNKPERGDWHAIRNTWCQLSPEGRPTMAEMAQLFPEVDRPAPDEPFPRFTKETAAKARMDVAKAQLRIRGVKVKEQPGA